MIDNNLKQLIEKLGLRKSELKENELKCLCPKHDDKSLGNFSINLTTGLAHCFACGYGDTLINMLYARGLTYVEANGLFSLVKKDDYKDFIIVNPVDRIILDYYKSIGYCEKSLERVKYDVTMLEDYHIYCDGDNHPLIFIPNMKGEIISLVVKYDRIDITLVSNNWKKLGCMYGLDLPNTSKTIAVEGVWDAAHIRKLFGYKVVAFGGTQATYNQLKNLETMGNVYIFMDFDEMGKKSRYEIWKNIEKYKLDFTQFKFCGSNKLKDVDPDDLSGEQIDGIIKTAKDYEEFGELYKEKQ